MPEFVPEVLLSWTGGTWSGRGASGRITGFTYDSRLISEGDCFVALKTEKRDGHDYLEAARRKGAAAALVSRYMPEVDLAQLVVEDSLKGLHDIARGHRREFEGTVIGITGSSGKTSTKDLLAHLVGSKGVRATEGNLNNLLGVPVSLLQLDSNAHSIGVIEAGMNQPGEIEALTRMIQPDVAMVTMVGPAHLEFLKTEDRIAVEKAKILQGGHSSGRNYFPESCLRFEAFRQLEADSIVLRPNQGPQAPNLKPFDYRFAQDVLPGGKRQSLVLQKGSGPVHIFDLPRLSPGMVSNAALCLAICLDMGLAPHVLREALADWMPSKNRGEIRQLGFQHFYLDCYNANPASMVDSIAAFEMAFDPQLPRLYVLGSMNELGEASERLHRETGESLQVREGDSVLFIGEFAEAMAEGFARTGPRPGSFQVFPTTEDAQHAVSLFRGAILLKGSRSYQMEHLLPPSETPAPM